VTTTKDGSPATIGLILPAIFGALLDEPIQVDLTVANLSAYFHEGDWVSTGASPDAKSLGLHAEIISSLLWRHHLGDGAGFGLADARLFTSFPAAYCNEQVSGNLQHLRYRLRRFVDPKSELFAEMLYLVVMGEFHGDLLRTLLLPFDRLGLMELGGKLLADPLASRPDGGGVRDGRFDGHNMTQGILLRCVE